MAGNERNPGRRPGRTGWLPYFLAVAALLLVGSLSLLAHRTAEPPIRIGVLHSLSGTMAISETPLVDAIRLAVEEINADGGLLGRPVELIVTDGRSDWNVFAAEAERLIVGERVSALFACWTSACRKAVKPVVERHGHLMFYPVQYEGMEQSPNLVYTGSTPNQQIIPGTRWAIDRFGKRVYLIGSDYVFPRAANRIIHDLITLDGGEILRERYAPLGADPTEMLIADLKQLQPDVILNTLNGDSNRHFLRALRQAELQRIPVLSFSLAEAELQAFGPELAHPNHFAAWSYFQSTPGEANRRFVEAFRTRYGPARVTSDPIEAAYNAVRLWANAVRETGTDAPEHVNRAIGRQSVSGPSGIVAIDKETRHLWKRARIGQARADGQFDELEASKHTLRPAPYPTYRSVEMWRRIATESDVARAPGQ